MATTNSKNTVRIPIIGQEKIDKNNQVAEEEGSIRIPIAPIAEGISYIQKSERGAPYEERQAFDYKHPTDITKSNLIKNPSLSSIEGNYGSYDYALGEIQPTSHKIAHTFLTRLPLTAATKLLEGIGYIGGAAGWAATGDIETMTENPFSVLFKDAEKYIKETAPIYKPKSVQEGSLIDNLGSASFWLDDAADAVAFMAGFAALSYATGGVGGYLTTLGMGSRAAQLTNLALTSTLQAVAEGGTEAAHFKEDFEYEAERVMKEYALELETAGLPPEEMQKALALKREELDVARAEAQAGIFRTNMGILIGPNMLMNKFLFGKFFNKSPQVLNRMKVPGSGEILKAPRKLATREIGLRYAQNIGGGIASEGFWEEGLQETANEYFKQVGIDETDDGFVEGMWNTYWSSWKDVDFQKAVFLGGFLGTLGGAKGSYSGIKSENKQVNQLREVLSRNPNTVLAKTFEGIKPTEEWTKHALDVYQKLNSLKTIHKRDSLKEVFDLMGEEDLSGLVSSHGLLDWGYSLLNIEGGNEILKSQIDNLTEIAYKEYEEKGGTESKQSFEQYKLNIKNQLDSMQEIVDEVNKNSGNIFAKIQNNRNIDSEQFEKYKNQVTTDITFAQVLTLNNLKYLDNLKKEKIQKIEQKNLENADKDPSQINQADKDTVKRLSTEIENINELYTNTLEDYNTLSNKETIRNYFSEYVDNKEDIQTKIEEFAANPREVNNKLEVPDKLSSIAEQAVSKEEFTNADGIKEEIETKKDLVLNIQDNNNNFRKLRVQFEGISSKEDSIKIRFYNEDGTPSKRIANLKANGTVFGDASIQKWGFDSIITKEENNARELFLGKFRETYESLVGEINSKQERLSNNTKAISNTLESIQDNIKEIESLNEDYNSENISEIEVNDANRSILEKLINKKLDNEIKLALNIKELRNLKDSLIELNDVYLSDLEKIEDFIAGIPADFKELHPTKFNQMIQHLTVQAEGIRQNTENSNNTIVELESLIKEYTEILSQLDNKIESIERQLDRFNVQDINDFNSLLPKELSKLRIRLGRELNIRRLINSRNQFADNLNNIIEQLQPLKARTDLLNTELEVIENTAASVAALSMLWQNLYGNLGKPKTPYTVIKSKNENVEDTLGEDNLPKKFAPPMKPFEGTVHAFLYTTTNEESLIKRLKENDLEKADAAEPELLFQRFIDTITEDNIEDITLQLFNRDNLLNKFENILSEAQKEYMNQDFMTNGVFVVPIYKNGKPRLSSSVLRKGEKSLIFSSLSENIGEIQVEGNEVYLERTNGTRFIDASNRVKDYTAQGWAESEAIEAVKKELEEAVEAFKTSVRQPVLEGKTPKYGIADINPGKYIPTSTPISITEALNKKIEEIELIVANKETEAFGIKTYNTTPGHVYLNYNNRIVPTLRSTLQEQHIERVLDIIKYIATLEKGQKAELDNALRAINDYTYLVFHSKAKKEGVNNFSFFIAEHKEELTQGVQFGEDFISKYELLSDIDSSLTRLRKFLETKFYQVDRDTLNKNEDITFKKVEKGQLVDAETLNYKEWLLDSKNPKLRVFLPSFPSENSIQKLTTPGVVNKSIKLDIESIPATRNIQNKKAKAIKKTKTIPITGEQNRKVLADDIDWERTQEHIDIKKSEGETIPSLSLEEVLKYDSEVTKIGELGDKSDIYYITLKKENKKESGYQVISKPPIVKEKAVQTSEKVKAKEEAAIPTEADQKLNEVASNLLNLSTKKPSPKTEKKEGNIIPPEDNVFSKREDIEDPFLKAPVGEQGRMDFEAEKTRIESIFSTLDIRDPEFKMIWDNKHGESAFAQTVFSKVGKTLIRSYEQAPKGALWHEAGHEWIRRHITPQERIDLLEETVKEAGNNVYTIEGKDVKFEKLRKQVGAEEFYNIVEEFLMEEFRNYVISSKNYRFGKASKKQNFFQRLWNSIVEFIEKFTGKSFSKEQGIEIVNTFEKILNGHWTEETVVNRPTETALKISGLDTENTNILVRHLNTYFFDFIFNKEVLDQINISDINSQLSQVYNILYDQLYEATTEYNNPVLNIMLNTWDDLVTEHIKFLRQYNIQLEVPESLTIERKETKDNAQYLQTNLVNVKETMPSEVKLLIAGLRGDIKQIRALNTPVDITVDFGKTLGLLQKRLSGINSLPTMLERVVELSKKHPYLNTLLERIGVNSDGTIKSNTTLRQEELRRKFFIHFHKADSDFITGIIGDEGYGYNISQESMTRKNKVLDMWKSNIKSRAGEKGSAFVLEKGRYKLDPTAIVSLLGIEISVKELFIGKKSIMSLAPTGKKKAFMKEFLNLFGIELSEDYRRSKLLEETISYLNNEVAAYIKDNTPLYADNIFDRNSIKIIKELNNLAEEVSNLDEYFIDNQINTQKGTEYSIQEKTKLHKVFDSLHSQEIPIDMVPFKDGEGNLGTYNSTWFEMSQKGNAPRVVVMKNLGEERGDKIDFDQLKPSDMMAFQINNILEGTISYPRSEGRGMEYAVNFGKDYIKKSISKKQQIDQYKKYLKSEILTSLAYKNTPEAKRFITPKQRNPEALVFFKDIIPELSKFLESTDTYNGIESIAWEETADNIMRLYNSQIEEGIDKFIDQSTATIIGRLQELKLVVDLSSENGAKVFDPIGFSPAIFSKNNLNIRKEAIKVTSEVKNKKGKTVKVISEYEVIDSSQLKQLANIISYYYTTAGIEFTKLITGDLATYMKGNISSYHKRTTTFTSTISGSLNDPISIEFLNKYYKRFDGTQHDTNRRTLVVSDVKVQSSLYPLLQEVLKDAAEAYTDMNEADGQTWASLDGYRSAALHTGIWNQNYERTWQYEAQLGFQLMRQWEERSNTPGKQRKFTIAKYKELFKEHLPTNFRENVQYYKGIPINIETIKEHSLPVLKLQGSGQIINEGLSQFNKMSITKTSVAPLLPSVIKETQLENIWAEKTIEGLDMLSFESAEKGERIGNEEGVLPSIYTTDKNGQGVLNSISEILNSGFIPTEVSWSDIGSQLEIDPSGKSKVTASSQQRALTFVDMFENGEIREEYQDMADSFIEYTRLQNELVNKARKSFLERLGVVENNEGLTLSEVEKLSQAIFSELNRRLVTDNLAEGVQLVLDSSIKLFDSLPNKRQLVNLLQGMFRSNTIAIKRSGDMLTQISSTGFETSRPDIKGSNHLKIYRPVKSDGTEFTLKELNALTAKDIVKIAPAQVEISLPKSWTGFLEVYYPQRSFQEKLDNFNKDILDPNWEYYGRFKKIRTFLANRIPGQHINSIEALEVVKFHSPTAGSMVILPSEIVAKSGSDFDIDKLTSYFNNIKIEEGIITYDEYSSDSEVLWTKYRNKVLRKEKAKELLAEMDIDLESLVNYDTFKLRIREVPEGEADLLKITETTLEAIYDEIIEDLPDLSKEEFLNLSIEQQNTKEAVENRLNEVTMSVILHPKNYIALMIPNGSNIVQEQANKLAARSEEVQAHELLNLVYNVNIAENQFSALSLLGIIAVNNTSHSKIQTSPIKYNSDVLKVLFQQFKNSEGETSLGYVRDQENNLISQNNSALISATVDAGKETFPAIFRLNYRTSTANPYQLLNRVGVGNTTPLGWRYLTEFFTSPIITEYINKRLVEESRVVNASRYVVSKQDTIKDLIGEPEGGLLMDSVVEFLSAKEQDIPHARAALIQATQSFIEKNGLMVSKDFTNNPVKTLQTFLYYLEISKTLHTVQNIIRPDTGLPKHTNTIRLRKIVKDRLEKLDIFDNASIEALIQNTFIREFQNTHNSTYEFMSEFDLSRISPAIDAYLWGTEEVPGLIDIYTNPQLSLPENKLEDIVQKLQNAIITSILHTTPRNKGALNQRYKEFFQGKNSYAKRLYRLAQNEQFKENAFLKEMQPVINEFIARRGKNSEVDYVKMFSRKIAVFDSNAITDSIRELIDSGNAEAIKIAEESIEMSVLQSGVQINPFAFFETLPTERYYPFIKNIINKYLELENSGDLVGLFGEALTDQIMSNLRFDSNIVPRFNPFRKGQRPALRSKDKLIVWEDSNSANYPYLSVEIDNFSPTERNKYKEEGRPIPKELFIYKDTGVIEKYGKVYERIPNYGDGSRIFEIQLDGKPSIIESNNVGGASRPDINTKKEELPEEYTHIPEDNFIEDYEAYKDSMAPSIPEFKPSKDFNKRFFALMEELGVNITKDSRIFTNGDVINSVKMFTFVKEIVDFVDGNLDASNFSEGTAGFIFNLLPETHILKKKELKNIENTRLYRELYDSQIENVPINQIKSEAIGRIIEEFLFTIESDLGRGYDVKNTWRGLSKWIKENFKLDTVVKKSLLSELENSYKELMDKSEEQSTEIKNKFFEGNTITDSKNILSRIVESGHPTAPLAEFLLNRLVDNYKIELVPIIRNRDISTAEELKSSLDSPDTTYSGLYRASEDRIYISSKFLGRKGIEVTILHEIIHAMSSRTLTKAYSSTTKDFVELYNQAKKYLPDNMYALRTPAEFLVGLFVDSSLIKPLSKVPSLSGIKEYKNLFLEIFDFILNIIGINKTNNLYAQAFNVATNVISEDLQSRSEFNREVAEFNTRMEQVPLFTEEGIPIQDHNKSEIKRVDTNLIKEWENIEGDNVNTYKNFKVVKALHRDRLIGLANQFNIPENKITQMRLSSRSTIYSLRIQKPEESSPAASKSFKEALIRNVPMLSGLSEIELNNVIKLIEKGEIEIIC